MFTNVLYIFKQLKEIDREKSGKLEALSSFQEDLAQKIAHLQKLNRDVDSKREALLEGYNEVSFIRLQYMNVERSEV